MKLLFHIKSFLKKILNNYYDNKVVKLKTYKGYKGNVLISYINRSFIKKIFKEKYNHSSDNECFCLVNLFLDHGFSVDLINWNNKKFIPKKNYKVFIDIHNNLERISKYINIDCIKILHITGANWLYQNKAELTRLLDLQNRRGITLIPRRNVQPSLAIEFADFATCLGNDFTIETFSFSPKSIYKIPVTSPVLFDFDENKNFEKCKKNFLWFGGMGLVHKGLDLVLEAFSLLPDLNLFVCGPIEYEKDFEKAFNEELYETKNIHTIGWVDIKSNIFFNIMRKCISVIFPSCSEGGGSSIITCMQAGLIPVVSYEASIDVEDFGFLLKESNVDSIINIAIYISNLNKEDLKIRSLKSWKYARENHTIEKYSEKFEEILGKVLDWNN